MKLRRIVRHFCIDKCVKLLVTEVGTPAAINKSITQHTTKGDDMISQFKSRLNSAHYKQLQEAWAHQYPAFKANAAEAHEYGEGFGDYFFITEDAWYSSGEGCDNEEDAIEFEFTWDYKSEPKLRTV